MTLFEFIDALFDKKAYRQVTDKDKKAYFFNLNRFLSHAYPVEINDVNNIVGMHRNHVPHMVDYWHRFLTTKFVRKPDFFFWKTSVATTEKDFLEKFDKSLIVQYRRFYKIDSRQFKAMCDIFPEEVEKEIKMYKDTLEYKSRKKAK